MIDSCQSNLTFLSAIMGNGKHTSINRQLVVFAVAPPLDATFSLPSYRTRARSRGAIAWDFSAIRELDTW